MHAVGETYEHTRTGTIFTVTEVGETWHTYGLGGTWKKKLVPRLTLMVVELAGTALGVGAAPPRDRPVGQPVSIRLHQTGLITALM
jgi:hypothetical protein